MEISANYMVGWNIKGEKYIFNRIKIGRHTLECILPERDRVR